MSYKNIDDNLVIAYNNRGVANREIGKLKEAVSDYTYIITNMHTQNATTFANRANAYVDLEKFDLALKDFESALKIDRAMYQIYVMRANLYAAMGNYANAITDLSAAIISKPEEPAYYYRRGYAYLQVRDCEHAVGDFSKTIAMKPDFGLAYYYLAQCLFEDGDFVKALDSMKMASRYKEPGQDFIDRELDALSKFLDEKRAYDNLPKLE